MKTFYEVWTHRILHGEKDWKGGDPIIGFDWQDGFSPDTEYDQHNWRDTTLKDFRQTLKNLYLAPDNVFANGQMTGHVICKGDDVKNKVNVFLSTSGDSLNTSSAVFYSDPGVMRVDITWVDQQTYVIFYVDNHGVYHLNWYKNRGSLDNFINLETGKPITLGELTHILVLMGLEDPIIEEEDHVED